MGENNDGRSRPALFLYFTMPEVKKVLKRILTNLQKYKNKNRDFGRAFGHTKTKILQVSGKVEEGCY